MSNTTSLKQVLLIASGDLRLAPNQDCWTAQEEMETLLTKAIERQGWSVKRAHRYDPEKKHGLIDSQKFDYHQDPKRWYSNRT